MEFKNSVVDHFKAQLAYDQWVGDKLLKSIEALSATDAAAVQRFAHILFAQEIWLVRLLGEDSSRFTTVWPDTSLAECRIKFETSGRNWKSFLEGLKEEDLNRVVSYKNTKGQPFQAPLAGIVTHVFDHSTYHRGQIATLVKKAGGEPPNIGFMSYVLEHP